MKFVDFFLSSVGQFYATEVGELKESRFNEHNMKHKHEILFLSFFHIVISFFFNFRHTMTPLLPSFQFLLHTFLKILVSQDSITHWRLRKNRTIFFFYFGYLHHDFF